jgi:hypothetical protein
MEKEGRILIKFTIIYFDLHNNTQKINFFYLKIEEESLLFFYSINSIKKRWSLFCLFFFCFLL